MHEAGLMGKRPKEKYHLILPKDLAKSPNPAQIKRMLKKAFNKFSNLKGLIFHSDQGLHGNILWQDEERDVLWVRK